MKHRTNSEDEDNSRRQRSILGRVYTKDRMEDLNAQD